MDGNAAAIALDSTSGAPLWAVPLAEQWDNGPYVTLAGDRLIATAGNLIAALDAASGFGGATVAAGNVLNMAGCGALARRVADGTTAWAVDPLCGGGDEDSAFDGERIWAGNHTGGRLHDPATGATVGRYEGGVPAFSGDLAVFLQAGAPVARDRHTLAERWRFTPQAPLVTAPLIADGVVYAADDPGTVYSVDLATGAVLATAATGERTNWQGSFASDIHLQPYGCRMLIKTETSRSIGL